MEKENKMILFDEQLHVEAYQFEGVAQSFPNHFHEYYVFGYVESGERRLTCKNRDYLLKEGQMMILNPYDNHGCVQNGHKSLNYRAISLSQEVMMELVEKISGKKELLYFMENVIDDENITSCFLSLHQMIMSKNCEWEKKESFYLLFTLLLQKYGQSFHENGLEYREEIESLCIYLETHYDKHIDLNDMCRYTRFTQSTLLRAFTKAKRMTPYRYLMAIRINVAQKLLEQGVLPVDVAVQVGFFDQGHMTKYFLSFMGISPGVYRKIFCERRDRIE